MSVVHIVGPDIQVGAQLRQRCVWCGVVLVDYALDRLMVPVDEVGADGFRPATWPIGALVDIDGGASALVPHRDGDPLPDNACGAAHPEVTV